MKFALLTILAAATLAQAAETPVLKLWPSTPPGPQAMTKGEEQDINKPTDRPVAGRSIIKLANVSTPEMHVFLAPKDKANGGSVIICPGGGFGILAWDLEGTEVAEWLNSIGFAAVVLKYRVPTGGHGENVDEKVGIPLKAVGPVMDAQRAVSITRAHAGEWGLDPKRTGIMGFSAGGATAGLTALLGEARAYPKTDAADEQPCAPSFSLLIYPAYFVEKETHALKPFVKVSKETPPTFLLMAQDDPIDSDNCTALFSALTRAKVPAEVHIFPKGGHGYGLRPTELPVTHWADLAATWLKPFAAAKP